MHLIKITFTKGSAGEHYFYHFLPCKCGPNITFHFCAAFMLSLIQLCPYQIHVTVC